MQTRNAPFLTQEARDAADHLLAAVGSMGMRDPQHEIAGRTGAAFALIANNANDRLRKLDIPDREQALAYLKAVGGGLGMTVKMIPADARVTVAAGLFFYMLDFLGHNAKGGESDDFVPDFIAHLLLVAHDEAGRP